MFANSASTDVPSVSQSSYENNSPEELDTQQSQDLFYGNENENHFENAYTLSDGSDLHQLFPGFTDHYPEPDDDTA